MHPISRRDVLVRTGIAAATALPATFAAAQVEAGRGGLKVLVAGAHPDDPESGCGGTIARYSDLGHSVTVLYLTRGEAGIRGKSHDEAGKIRTLEAEKACQILKARPTFAGQINGAVEVNDARYTEVRVLIEAEKPDVVLTHWPIDSHPDHRACSSLTYDAWLHLGRKFALYYFEVDLGAQTQNFRPTNYVNVTKVEDRKRDACMAHVSQNPAADFWGKYHEPMLRFRGMESGFSRAEAFVHQDQSPIGRLPDA